MNKKEVKLLAIKQLKEIKKQQIETKDITPTHNLCLEHRISELLGFVGSLGVLIEHGEWNE